MEIDYFHLNPAKWREFNPPSGDFVVDYIDLLLRQHSNQAEELADFLNQPVAKTPFVIGVAGSVAVGKSTFANTLQEKLTDKYPAKNIFVVSTDGFLMSNNELNDKNLMDQKGFPVSFNWKAMNTFLQSIKEGKDRIPYRLYSQEISDLVPDRVGTIENADIVILEGINALQNPTDPTLAAPRDFLDLGIYLDADEATLTAWFMDRFHKMLEINKDKPDNFYYEWAHWPKEESDAFALKVWRDVNLKNLHEFILPSKKNADLIIEKDQEHNTKNIYLKKF